MEVALSRVSREEGGNRQLNNWLSKYVLLLLVLAPRGGGIIIYSWYITIVIDPFLTSQAAFYVTDSLFMIH
jgi:hypothetical protein